MKSFSFFAKLGKFGIFDGISTSFTISTWFRGIQGLRGAPLYFGCHRVTKKSIFAYFIVLRYFVAKTKTNFVHGEGKSRVHLLALFISLPGSTLHGYLSKILARSCQDLGKILAKIVTRYCQELQDAMVRSYQESHVSKKNLTKKPNMARKI